MEMKIMLSIPSITSRAIKDNNGVLYLHDKSPAEDIYDQLGMSKKDFKKAIGGLYKSKLIALHSDCVSLL
jgi:predicted RNA-binding protein (virulence factor B family)